MTGRFKTIDADELKDIHDRIAMVFRMAGLQGPTLDEAIASVTMAAMDAIEKDRQAKADRLSRIRLVET